MKGKGWKRFVNGIMASLMAVSLTVVSLPLESQAASTEKQELSDESKKIQNDIFWEDMDGNTLYSQGGGIFKFDDTYYWYGVKYKNAPNYVNNPTKIYNSGDTYSDFESVTCYSSTDLVNWKFEGDVVTEADVSYRDEMEGVKASWFGRLGVAKVGENYVMMVQHECADPDDSLDALEGYTEPSGQKGWSKQVLVLTSDSPTGEFKWNQRINMLPYTGGTTNTGDQTVFTDEDTGKSYLVYSYGVGRGKIFLAEIEDQGNGKFGLSLEKNYMVYSGAGREGDCMFKYNGAYYICASDLYGWNASHAYYLKLDSLEDDYLKNRTTSTSMNLMDGCSDDYCHVTQTGFFYTVQGSKKETVIFCGDRWAEFAGNGLGFNQWCPLSFDESGAPYFNSLSSWYLDEATGTWSVAEDNNYVKNGSFDADRISVTALTGWTNSITVGNSPIKNSGNRTTGKYGLALTDTVDFDCSISQIIQSSPYVELPDGVYTLSAKVKNSGDFENLEIYAEADGLRAKAGIKEANSEWTTVTLSDVNVAGGKVEIGIAAKGAANAYCYIDDIMFIRTGDASEESGIISGSIQSDIAGKTLTIAAVQTDGTAAYTYETELTEGEQNFTLGPIKAGKYSLSASSYGCKVEAEGTEVAVVSGQTASGVVFRVENNMGSVRGKVVNGTGEVIPDVTVTLSKGTLEKDAVTDANGEYVFSDVEAGEYNLSFEKTGYASEGSVKVTIEKGNTVTLENQVLVRSTGIISGKVYDASGEPAANATVMLRGCESISDTTRVSVTTDENGRYTFSDVVAGTYAITASNGKWDTDVNAVSQNVEVVPGETEDVNLDIPSEITIVNGGFESGMDSNRQPKEGWDSTGSSGRASNEKNRGHVYAGSYGYTVWTSSAFTVGVSQKITGLEDGIYAVNAMVAAGSYSDSDTLYLFAKNDDGTIISKENVPLTVATYNSKNWELIGLTVEVTDGTLTFGIEGSLPGGAWANFDNFRVGKVEGNAVVEVDKDELKTIISAVQTFDTSSYTAGSISEYQSLVQTALTAAENVMNNSAATQDDVNTAVSALNEAFTSAKEKLVTLEAKLAQDIADSIKDVKSQEEYTEESWNAYEEALEAAQALQSSCELTEEKLNAAITELQKAVASLQEKAPIGDKTDLESLIAEIKNFDTSGYTAGSVSEYQSAVQTALTAAEAVKNNNAATQEEINAVALALKEAFVSAKEKLVALEVKLAQDIADSIKDVKSQEEYTKESWGAYEKALKAAQALQGSSDLTEEKLNAAVADLKAAVSKLAETAKPSDKAALENLITEIKNFDTSTYTPESVSEYQSVVQAALAKGEAIMNNSDATKEEVDEIVSELESVFASGKEVLKKATVNPKPDDGKGDQSATPDDGKDKTPATSNADKGDTVNNTFGKTAAKTGDTNSLVWFAAIAAAATVVVCITGLRRRKRQ